MTSRKKKAGALPVGWLPSGREGAQAIADELRAWSARLGPWLDKRPDRAKPVTETELKRRLMRRPLNLAQSKRATLGGLLGGLFGCGPDGQIVDARGLDARTATTPTFLEASQRVDELVASQKDPETARHLGYILARKLDQLSGRLADRCRFDLESSSKERREQRAAEASVRRTETVRALRLAQQRDMTGDWSGATLDEHADGALIDLVTLTAIRWTSLPGMRRTLRKRFDAAASEGIAPAELRSLYRRHFERAGDLASPDFATEGSSTSR